MTTYERVRLLLRLLSDCAVFGVLALVAVAVFVLSVAASGLR